MKQTKHTLIKGVALLLAAMMAFGDPVSALAAVPEAAVTTDAAVTDASDADYSAEALGADTLSLQTEEDQELSDEAKQALLDAAIESETEIDTIKDSDVSDLPEEVILKLGDGEEKPAETEPVKPSVVKEVKESDFEATRYATRVLVKNKTTLTGAENDLFCVLVIKKENNKRIYCGTRIPVGESRSLYTYYDTDYNEKELNTNDDYELWLSWVGESSKDDEGNPIEPDPYIGYWTEYDAETGDDKKDAAGNIIYDINIGGIFTLLHDKITEEPAIAEVDWQKGEDINFKAAVQKNMTIKFTWSPNSKVDLKQKTFKKYQLYELVPDVTNEATGYKEGERIWPVTGDDKQNKKSVVLKDGVLKDNKINSSMLYLLKCYDAGDVLVGQYVTTLAPYVFRFQSGSNTGMFDYMFTESNSNVDYMYRMGIAAKNKEYSEKVKDGFQDKWTSVMSSRYAEVFEEGVYPVNKTTNVSVLQGTYSNEEPEIMLANQYFGRIQTVVNVGKLQIVSTPSNVLNCKAGPERCYLITAAGVKYDTDDAKKNKNTENLKRANAFINYYFGFDEVSLDRNIMIHNDNESVDIKSGLIYFVAPDNMSNIKAFDLLRCNTLNGTFKKVKTYKVTDNTVLKCSIDGWSDTNLYAIQYTNFPYEQDFYYAVRAVSTVKNVFGGIGTAKQIEPQMDKVQGFSAGEMGADSISISWLHDDCVKEYWVYRSETSVGGRRDMAGQSEYIGKVGGKSFKSEKIPEYDDEGNVTNRVIKYHLYYDKTVKANKWYYYYVRPVFDTKAAKNSLSKYMEYSSDEYAAKASATFSQVKNFKASNYATGMIKNSFTQLKEINMYKIWRTEVSSSVTKLPETMKPNLFDEMKPDQSYDAFIEELSGWSDKQWIKYFSEHGNWELADTVDTTGKATSTYNTKGHDANVGSYYFYLIQPIAQNENGKSVGIMFSYSGRIRNMPLPVENVKASYNGSGVSLSWNLNANEKNSPRFNDLSVQIKYDGSWHNASRGGYYDDTLSRGSQRTYYIRVKCDNYYSSEKSITYSLPERIEVSKSGGDGTFKDNVLEIEVDQSADMTARACLNNGSTAAYNVTDWSYNNDIFEITGSGNTRKVIGKKVGTATLTIRSAGIKKTITVRVKKKSTQ